MFGLSGIRYMNRDRKLEKFEIRDVEKILKRDDFFVVREKDEKGIYIFKTDSRCRKGLSVGLNGEKTILLNRNDEVITKEEVTEDKLGDLKPEIVAKAL